MDKVREEFEADFIKYSGINCLELCDMVDALREDRYHDPDPDIKFVMNIGWKMYKASRKSLTVEIPKKVKLPPLVIMLFLILTQ